MRQLFILELKFAALRDKLYVERMEEAAAEEDMVVKGASPNPEVSHSRSKLDCV